MLNLLVKQSKLKMKKLFILLVLFGCTVFSYAQADDVFPLYGAKWTEASGYADGTIYYSYETIGDTIINGIKWSNIYKSSIKGSDKEYQNLIGFIRTEGMKVIGMDNIHYNYDYNNYYNEYVLYDFGLGKGDTLRHFDYSETVVNVDTIKLLNNVERKLYLFHGTSQEVIEGVGSTKGLYGPLVHETTGMSSKILISFCLNGELLYLDSGHPEWANGNPQSVAELPSYSPVRVYTDPVSGTFRIVSSGLMNRISVYDTQGRLCKETDCGGEADYSINSKGLPAGVYLVKVQMQNGKEEKAKVVIR
ncbi:hypothetical protein Barb7_00945 [Bacteroidales bacterium Barb7]|nr:hypothetical protein Barb7_00945 [Bacteroidales bacterium Barb7]